jgi:cellulose synthase/poly-beta-1,6-N-acetylglucosamine synthase-like glycosyltransferase
MLNFRSLLSVGLCVPMLVLTLLAPHAMAQGNTGFTAPLPAAQAAKNQPLKLRSDQGLAVAQATPRSPVAGMDPDDAQRRQTRVDRLQGSVSHSAISIMAALLFFIVLIMMVYTLRHVLFALNRLLGKQRHPYIDIDTATWPRVTVFVAAHNEERVIAGCLDALLRSNYPPDRLKIVAVNDRSTDATRAIVDAYVARYGERIVAFHRTGGKPGKAAALKEALSLAEGDISINFDADYVPGEGLLKQLVAPFFDPEVGAVMGRVVPINAGSNLLTRMLDLERSAGYQVDQQARMNLKLVPQYGGTVGGVRLSAVAAVGGWHDDMLAEDTDITYRLLLNGWKTVYTNRSECYEEVPEDWAVRIKQVKRWSKGHNQVLARYWFKFATSPFLSWRERLDGILLLFVFLMPPVLLVGWVLAISLYFVNAGALIATLIPVLALMAYGTLGNFAAFLEIAIGVLLDGNRRRLRLMPLNLMGFVVSLFSISSSVWSLALDHLLKRDIVWDKTLRYRKPTTK